jgi:hypothetical protein
MKTALLVACCAAGALAQKFEITFPASVHSGPLTGRVFVMLAKQGAEPMRQAGNWGGQAPFFGVDVDELAPGHPAVIDAVVPGYPVATLKDVPPGEYWAQALINVYTKFPRADGHTIWAHMDQWEGQHFARSPGNLYSETRHIHVDANATIRLELTKVIPPVEMPKDTVWIKHVKIQSPLLTKFWGHPIFIGATVLLPKGYDEHPEERYPAIYSQGHFGLNPAFGFSEHPVIDGPGQDGHAFYEAWNSDNFPRMIAVTFQHPTPYFDDSYAVNSANNGPYGDALLQELIPYLEDHFRMIREPYARLLTGGSTGGWESLALQLYHPGFFGGTWTFYPDPLDFHKFQMMNIYEDPNAFSAPGYAFQVPERPMMRTAEGQVLQTMREMAQLEAALGSKGRSGQQLEAFEAVFGPVGDDGYPKPLVDKLTGKIDRDVANYMRDHGFDLTYYTKTNWKEIGPKLKGKIHVYVGDMDNFYLNLGVYLFEDFMKTTDAAAKFEYGRPMKGHGWQPMSNAELVKMMAEQVERNKPR